MAVEVRVREAAPREVGREPQRRRRGGGPEVQRVALGAGLQALAVAAPVARDPEIADALEPGHGRVGGRVVVDAARAHEEPGARARGHVVVAVEREAPRAHVVGDVVVRVRPDDLEVAGDGGRPGVARLLGGAVDLRRRRRGGEGAGRAVDPERVVRGEVGPREGAPHGVVRHGELRPRRPRLDLRLHAQVVDRPGHDVRVLRPPRVHEHAPRRPHGLRQRRAREERKGQRGEGRTRSHGFVRASTGPW